MSAILTEIRDHVRFITLNRPERHNAFDDAVIQELTAAFETAATEPNLRAVVLDSLGRSFSAGADINWMRRMADYDRDRNLSDARALARLMQAIDTCPRPVVGVVQGAAYGGGVGLAACCDLVVAAEESVFCLSEVKIGIIPAVISPYVMRSIGVPAARRYFLTAEVIPAVTAKEIGLVHEVVPAEDLVTTRDRWLSALKANSPHAVTAAKGLVARLAPIDAAMIEWTAERIADLRASEQGQEGLKAFLERRKPSWNQTPVKSGGRLAMKAP